MLIYFIILLKYDCRSKGRENQRLRRLVKCFLPCGKPFWKILFLLVPLYILFSPILVPVFLIYTCICGCRDCMSLKPSRNGTTNHVAQGRSFLDWRHLPYAHFISTVTVILVCNLTRMPVEGGYSWYPHSNSCL